MDSDVSKARQIAVAVFFAGVAVVIAAVAYWLAHA